MLRAKSPAVISSVKAARRSLLDYVKGKDESRYTTLIKRLDIRR